ncbi:MAG: cyclic nucleotide-binding domain-containing protein [Chitinispirillaceae bacterium]|nr:cyclic nucleotide-binding domain-containing protein [Chitinispirillaceae bacterium]
MYTIPLISTSTRLFDRLKTIVRVSSMQDLYRLLHLTNTKAAEEFLTTDMPELIFINFSDTRINAKQLLQTILNDPWLLHGGIIAMCRDYKTVEEINSIKGANILVSLTFDDLEKQLPSILDIIHNNRRILFQRGIGQDIVGSLSGSFKIRNNVFEASCYANLICNFMYNSNKLTVDKKYFFHLALYEMLINAIEHGNCGITYDEKSVFLERGRCMTDLIEEKCKDPDIARKTVTFDYTFLPEHGRFVITDEGDGFDWRAMLESIPERDVLRLHGRGIIITRETVQKVAFNEKGNEVTLEIAYEKEGGAITPALFSHIEPIEVGPGDIVINQGDPSNFLYFIVKGLYEIIVNDKKVSTLSADDIFMGEMSFLLNDRRSATVRAASRGKLIKITKKEFVRSIKKKPHYALFLARLLAERVQRLNQSAAMGGK